MWPLESQVKKVLPWTHDQVCQMLLLGRQTENPSFFTSPTQFRGAAQGQRGMGASLGSI